MPAALAGVILHHMHTAPAPSGHPVTWSTSNLTASTDHPGVIAAAQRLRAAESAHAEATIQADAARGAERIAAEGKVAADARVADLRRTFERAAEEARRAELAWQANETSERWDAVEAARSARAKAELRLRSDEGEARLAEGHLAVASRRASAASSAEADALAEVTAARGLLEVQRTSARALSEAEAARAAEAARVAEAQRRDVDEWHQEVARTLVPVVERYLRAVVELRAAEVALAPVLLPLNSRGRQLAAQGGDASVSVDLDLRIAPADLLALAAREAWKTLAPPNLGWKRDVGPWGDAPFARPKMYTREGSHRGRNALFDTIRAAVERFRAA